jgi:O-Antigen ligase
VRGRRATATVVAAALLLAAPTVLAFFSGGYFAGERLQIGLAAGIVVWLLVAALAFLSPRPLPASSPGRLCLAGLAGLAAWTAVSLAWTPTLDPGLGDSERAFLYLGFLIAAAAVLRERPRARLLEPVLAGGVALVCAYALATRLLPTLVPSNPGLTAGTRLDQPLTYWNSLGALFAIGIALCLRLASDAGRPRPLRLAGAAAVPALGLGLFLTVSRGALAAAIAGAIVLVLLARDRRTLAAIGAGAAPAVAVALAASRFPGVIDLEGSDAARRDAGLAVLAVLTLGCALAAAAQARLIRLERDGPLAGSIRLGRLGRALAAAACVAALVAGGAVVLSAESGTPAKGVERFGSTQSNRYDYWDVALDGFAGKPLAGEGAHGFATLWLEQRDIAEGAQDAHSLYLETLAELGLVGGLLLVCFLAGAAACLWRARRAPGGAELTTGWAAAGSVFLLHAAVDWDWEMPALTLVFLLLCGAAVAAADGYPAATAGREPRERSRARDTSESSPTAPSTSSAGSAPTRKRVTP